MKPKEKGDVALGQAINYFMLNGYEVCLPIGDKRNWDIIVEKDDNIKRVQVKFAGLYSRDGKCKAGLRITGGNQSYFTTKKYSQNDFDLLFIYSAKGNKYCLPWKDVTVRNEITIEDSKYKQYEV